MAFLLGRKQFVTDGKERGHEQAPSAGRTKFQIGVNNDIRRPFRDLDSDGAGRCVFACGNFLCRA
ncbi:hypothetical protein [Novosphingobium endophyticum]|uniref:hypothetical protein n=1 Tax=Novosphingobium endophyticum TaxID=1955250 RepID=UPI00166B04E7|nr:hypothetical protein [Novosphingobium endophyticum]